MKILFLNPVASLGGAERSLIEIFQCLRAKKPDWQLKLVCGDSGPLIRIANDCSIKSYVLPFPNQLNEIGDSDIGDKPWPLNYPWRIYNLFSKLPAIFRYQNELSKILDIFKPDIVHSNGFKFHLLTGLSKSGQSNIVWHARDYLSNRGVLSKVLPWVCKLPKLVITNSESVRKDWIKVLPKARFKVIHNTVRPPEFLDSSRSNESPFKPCESNCLRVGLIASFAKWKGHQIFFKALAGLINDPRVMNCHFYVVGGPIYKTKGSQWSLRDLEDYCSNLGIRDRVLFIPHQENMDLIYRNLDVIVHASTKPEPFGRTIIEGMAYGKAIVASKGGGVDEIISNGIDSLGFTPGDDVELAEKIRTLVIDEKLRFRLGIAGREKVLKHFSTETGNSKIISAFEEISRNGL